MFELFTQLGNWLAFDIAGLTPDTKIAQAVQFFIEDTTKIYALLLVMIYCIALVRASLSIEKIRYVLAGKNRAGGYFLGATFGAITPFCSCSSIPVFLGFTSAGIPIGITMAFLFTSPLINEIAVLLLFSLLGWKFTLIYIAIGMTIGMVGGFILDLLHAEKMLKPFAAKAYQSSTTPIDNVTSPQLTLRERHNFAVSELKDIFSRVWLWVIIGVGLGAGLHGFMPDNWFQHYLGDGQWWSVPVAVLVGIPLYSNATGVIPVMESLLNKGLPIGTTLAFCMSTVAASFPEFVMLKQVMSWRLLALIFFILLFSFTSAGWLLNAFQPFM